MAKTTKADAEDRKEKIREAKYFLNRIQETQNDPQPFSYNLSAFLAAFRSIRLFSKTVLGDPKLDPCYKELRKWMDKDHRAQLLKEERNITTHERIISKHNDAAVTAPTAKAKTRMGRTHLCIENEDGSVFESSSEEVDAAAEESGGEENSGVKYTWYFTQSGNTENDQKIRAIDDISTIIQTDVITICKGCFDHLMNIMSKCDKDIISD